MWSETGARGGVAMLAAAASLLALAACTSSPTIVYVPVPSLDPVVRPAPTAASSKALQAHPNCLPTRRASADGMRTAVGIRAETCMAEEGGTGAFIVRLIDIQGIPSPARAAGLEVGDHIRALDGCLVRTAGELTLEVEGIPEDFTTELLVRRDGKTLAPVKVSTQRWRPNNPNQARAPGAEGNLCHLAKRPPPGGMLSVGNR